MYTGFLSDIAKMNARYELGSVPKNDAPLMRKRLAQFEKILFDECTEIEDIPSPDCDRMRVELADLLGDIIVYCTSEAQRWGIPIDQVLAIIMASNDSKLGADGKPIKNPVTDKFEKGPNYWKPEPLIRQLLSGEITDIRRYENGDIRIIVANSTDPSSAEPQNSNPQA